MTREEFIYGLTACGCLLKDGKTWYEHNELIECFENLGLFEQEPTTKNDLGVDLISRTDAIRAMQDKAKKLTNEDTINGLCGAVAILFELPSVTPQLSVPEVTALAEWTTKLTKASEDAYNKGYADGMKDQELILDKIRAEIEQARYGLVNDGLDIALNIIDKYKAESEKA